MMIIFHLFYDLNHFKFINIQMKKDIFWYMQPKIIITLFLISVGMNLCIAHGEKVRWQKFSKRLIKLVLIAGSISLITSFVFPGRWIYFGILHNVSVSSVLALAFLKRPKLSLILGLIIVIPSIFFNYKYPFFVLTKKPVDHVALFPWFGCVLMGIFLYSKGIHNIKIPDYKFKNVFSFLGRYSLEIYLLHQAILFPLVYLIRRISH